MGLDATGLGAIGPGATGSDEAKRVGNARRHTRAARSPRQARRLSGQLGASAIGRGVLHHPLYELINCWARKYVAGRSVGDVSTSAPGGDGREKPRVTTAHPGSRAPLCRQR